MPPRNDERQPLLNGHSHNQQDERHDKQKVAFDEDDEDNPCNWPTSRKWSQVLQITIIAFLCPASSSIVAPAASEIQESLGVSDKRLILAGQSGFVCMLGLGPLLLAPLSETFGRRPIFLTNLAIFTLLQVPIAMAPEVYSWIVLRTLSGFFGSVGVANGGGSISDMFETHERAKVLGIYLLAPLLGPSIGPMVGGIMVGSVQWRWIFWLVFAVAVVVLGGCYFCLHETRAVTILQKRKKELEKKEDGTEWYIEGDTAGQSLMAKVAGNSTRAVKILATQPIVLTMSLYQALVFSSMYSLYASYTSIWSAPPYNFSKTQVGLAYLGPALGFIITSFFIVFFIDRLYNWLAERNDDDGQPEYRLPMANVGAVLLPISLFWFGWTVEMALYWPIPLAATLLFGASQVSIFNTVQTYYIDAYESNAASALAAGAFLRSMFGGIIPLLVGGLFDQLGYGWGMSVFGFISLALMPAPLLFYYFGRRIRERFPFKG
ncbi:Efflux pump vrtL [Fulvia fulva]|uniref:Efflux pump vrtL n=1 Tax=Passalora fulva TaxID=5499 RepID=A0A9Q8PFI2_PASFU|nr:Efflux pump vrtL [Fulvia fulva]KAK4613618.1 Efflux pump vrtL [Fulvia fulva]KAK4614507.1 Efflux pump vrtL [Fulvia fulva]UJO21525.1 Efflux pump vrtL [Fulvia fulva]WPV20805.1 Efflux pump vrtL [Fulvia fulva]WPV34959.1 Efflux pump vrtL [Fulvia fulva]